MLIAIVASLGVQAAPPPSPPSQNASPEIVVQGQRDTERRIGEFVRVMTNEPVTGQIGRFDWSVCPTVTGLSGRQNSEAAERMRAVAGAAGMRVARLPARPECGSPRRAAGPMCWSSLPTIPQSWSPSFETGSPPSSTGSRPRKWP